MGTIVAIGGGELKDKETLAIDKKIIELTQKDSPRALFIPTASNDAEGYWETFKNIYTELGCTCDVLYLIKEALSDEEVENKIMNSDLIYVGGGNTRNMLKIWKEKGVDRILKKAFDSGIILSGLSAGAVCWFKYASSDSEKIDLGSDERLILINGLNFLDGLCSPHHIREPERTKELPRLIKETNEPSLQSYALDDNAALIYTDGEVTSISSQPDRHVRKVYFKDNQLVWEIL